MSIFYKYSWVKVNETEKQTMKQLTIDFDPNILKAWPTLTEYMQYCAHTCGVPMGEQAQKIDLSPSHWSRKLASSPNDSMRLTVADVESWIEKLQDNRPAQYLAAKFLSKSELINKVAVLQSKILTENGDA